MKVLSSPLLAGTDIQEQIDLETTSVQSGVVRYRRLAAEATRRGRGAQLKPAERLIVAWLPRLASEIRKLRRLYVSGRASRGVVYWGPLILAVPAPRMALLALDKLIGMCLASEEPIKYTSAASAVGAAIVAEMNLEHYRHRVRAAAKSRREAVMARGLEGDELKEALAEARKEARRDAVLIDNIMDRSDAPEELNRTVRSIDRIAADSYTNRASLGDRILHAIAREVAILPHEEGETSPEEILAFKIDYRYEGKRRSRTIALRDKTLRIIEEGHQSRQRLRPMYLPMIVPPYRRDRSVHGGYITLHTPFVTKSTPEQQEAYKSADLSYEYEALTALGAPPHIIMEPVDEVRKRLAEEGGGLLGIPPARDDLKPPRPAAADTDPVVEKAWKREAYQWHQQRIANLAARESFSQLTSIIDMFKGRTFYFPHQNDYRGRAYPIPQYLNTQGPDLCRALLAFARPVEPDQKWLHIHVANCAGFDKASFDERAQWAHEWIVDHSVGRWIKSPATILDHIDEWGDPNAIDAPWQFLAALIAVHDPKWGARLPVQIDGSCNGLQHYAAMTRDEELAAIVNLRPANRPHGIYQLVADRTIEILKTEADPMARVLETMVDKSIVKQPTMTTVYGVTFAGARDQIAARLEDKGVSPELRFPMAQFLTKIVLRSIEGLCGRAAGAMAWIRECATEFARLGLPYRVTAPTGLPMVQPYRRWHTKELRVMNGTMSIVLLDRSCPIAKGEHIRGSAPNSVHTIDQAHMKRVGIGAVARGIDATFVHDGFRSQSGNIERAGFKTLVHDQFVALHETDWLAAFYAEWRRIYPEAKIQPPPERGAFDIREVLWAPYAFH